MIRVYRLQIVTAEDDVVATFNGKGTVERDLMAAVSAAIVTRVPEMVRAMQRRGRWWLRPSRFDQAVTEVLSAAVPQLVAEAVNAVLLEVKQEATDKMHG